MDALPTLHVDGYAVLAFVGFKAHVRPPLGFEVGKFPVAKRLSVVQMLSMKMIPSRELSARPGAVWADLATESMVVITRDGQPMGIITPTSASTLMEDMQSIAFAKARRAVQELRNASVANGTAAMSAGEIEAEILLARKARRIGRRRK